MTDLKNNILEQITTGEIKQTSRWYFVSRDYLFYVLTVLTSLLGALAISSILFQTLIEHAPRVRHVPWNAGYFKSVVETAPWLWVVAFVLLVVVAWFNYKNTSRSYRHHNGLVVALVLLVSIIGGFVLFKAGIAKRFEEGVRKHIPAYRIDAERRDELREQFLERNPDPNRPTRPPRRQ